MSVADAVKNALSPYVGAPMAGMFLHGAAAELGVPSEALAPGNVDAIVTKMKKDLSAFVSAEILSTIEVQIRAATGT